MSTPDNTPPSSQPIPAADTGKPSLPSLPSPLAPPPSLPPRDTAPPLAPPATPPPAVKTAAALPTNLPPPPAPAAPAPAPTPSVSKIEPMKAPPAKLEPAAPTPAPIPTPTPIKPEPANPSPTPTPAPEAAKTEAEAKANPEPKPELKPEPPKATPVPALTGTPPTKIEPVKTDHAKTEPTAPRGRLPLPLLSRTAKSKVAEAPATTAAAITPPMPPTPPAPTTPSASSKATPASPSVPAPAATAEIPAPPKRAKRIPPIVSRIVGWILAIALIGGLAYGAVYYLRQTQMIGLIVAPGYLLPEKVAVIRDFSGDVSTLRTEFRSARSPFEKDLAEKETNLKRIASDLAVVEQRKKLFQQGADEANAEVSAILDKSRAESDALWKNTGGALDAEYSAKTDGFLQALVDRAAAIKLPFTPNPDANPLRSPDVWANAFRLALYNPPPPIKPVAEREWLEKMLVDWHAYEKTFDERRAAIKVQAAAIRKAVSPKMDEIRARVDKAASDVAAAEADAAPLRDELATAKVEAENARDRIKAQRDSYIAQLQDIPKRNLLQTLPVDSRGRFRWEHLEANTQYPPGDYLLWVELKKDDQPYWAVVPFTVKEYQRLSLILKPGAFVPAFDLIQ